MNGDNINLNQAELLVPRSRTVIRQHRAFSVSGPTAWNGLQVGRSWVDYLEGALYKAAVIRIRDDEMLLLT